jgi:hypothetical protein
LPGQRHEKAANEARLLALEGNWSEAERVVSEALTLDPAAQILREALAEVQAGKARLEKEDATRDALREMVAQARKARETGDLGQARDKIRQGLERFPDAKQLVAEREALRRAFNDRREKLKVQNAVKAIEEQLAGGSPREAQRLLDVALKAYPGNAALDVLKSRVALALRRSAGLKTREVEPPAPPLEVRAESPPSQLSAETPPGESARPKGLLYGGVGAVALAAVALVAWLALRDTGPAPPPPVTPPPATEPAKPDPAPAEAEKKVEPVPTGAPGKEPATGPAKPAVTAEMEIPPGPIRFSYTRGQPAPPPSTVMMRIAPDSAPVDVAVDAGAGWLRASAAGKILTVRVDPRTLAVAEYQAAVRVRSSGLERSMRVVLAVLEPQRPLVTPPAVATPAKPPEPAPAKAALTEPPPSSLPTGPWGGARQGTITWIGQLLPGGRLVLGDTRVLEGGGNAGTFLLPPNVTVQQTDPAGLQAEIGPAPNQRRITIVNNAGRMLPLIKITWRLK